MDPLQTPMSPVNTELSGLPSDKKPAENIQALQVNDVASEIFDLFGKAADLSEQASNQQYMRLVGKSNIKIGAQAKDDSISEKQKGIAEKQKGIAEKQKGIAEKQESIAEKQEGIAEKQKNISAKQTAKEVKTGNIQTSEHISAEMKSVYIVIKSALNEAKLVLAHTSAPHELHAAHTENRLGKIKGDELYVYPESGLEYDQKISVVDEHGRTRTLVVRHFTADEVQQLSLLVTTYIAQQPQTLTQKQEIITDKNEHEVLHSHKETKSHAGERKIRPLEKFTLDEASTEKEALLKAKNEKRSRDAEMRKIIKEGIAEDATRQQRDAAKKAAKVAKELLYEQKDILNHEIMTQNLRLDDLKKRHANIHVIHIPRRGNSY